MRRKTLKDARYRTIGYIDTAADGRQTAMDAQLRIVGYYDPRSDLTQDARLRGIGSGNLLATLIVRG